LKRLVFCNIGWMNRYRGNKGQPDKIVGGGSHVDEHETGGEVCNFVACENGFVYGYVESIKGEIDRQIRIEKWGDGDEYLSGIDLVWMATYPDEKGRRVIGWYQNATIFRERQHFESPPSKQHKRDSLDGYRVRALAEDAHILAIEGRTLIMPQGKGWLGMTPWWSPSEPAGPEVQEFLEATRQLIAQETDGLHIGSPRNNGKRGKYSPDTAKDSYIRYIEENEIYIAPKHNQLQEKFEKFLTSHKAKDVTANWNNVDLQYRDAQRGNVLVEVKPCDNASVRYAIRTAIGQLLDYRQRVDDEPSLLIITGVKPSEEDQLLATSNGFGIAYPVKKTFEVIWPTQ